MITMNAAIIIAFAFICKISVSEQYCGDDVQDISGYILSPNYPSNYGNNITCNYIITTPDDTWVSLEIVDMHTESGHDFVNFYNGSSITDQQIGRFSGTYYNFFINATTTSEVLVQFTTDGNNSYSGFNVSFTAVLEEPCGGDFSGSSGLINSPIYPYDYPANLDCYYSITTSENTAMTLGFPYFSVEQNNDYVIIYDGPTAEYNIIGNFTGYILFTDVVYVSTNQALVYFHSDSSNEYSDHYYGFQINFWEQEICEEENFGSYGAVVSQGYPTQPYPSNQNCIYKVTTSENTAVNLDIKDMNLEADYDYIKIYDGPTTSSPLIGRYTGKLLDHYVYGSTNEVLIYFHSNNDGYENRGFYIYFTERDQICPAGSFTSDSGVITSPWYPDTYPNNTDCYYSITTSSNTQLTLHADIDIETSSLCENDYVEVFDGPSSDATSMNKLCGSGPVHDIISSSNKVFVHFHSDKQNEGDGFNISYNTDPCPTSTTFYGDFGTIYSPGFPISSYPKNADCSYHIEATELSKVHITVVYVDLTSGGLDNVIIYDGPTENSQRLAILNGTKTMQEFQASSNQVLITFHSDIITSYNSGFVINYVTRYYEEDNL